MPVDSRAIEVTWCSRRKAAMAFRPAVWAGNSRIKQEAASVAKPTQTQWEREPMSMPAACGGCTGSASTWAASRCRRASLLTLARVLRRVWAWRWAWAGAGRPLGGEEEAGWCPVVGTAMGELRKQGGERGSAAMPRGGVRGSRQGEDHGCKREPRAPGTGAPVRGAKTLPGSEADTGKTRRKLNH